MMDLELFREEAPVDMVDRVLTLLRQESYRLESGGERLRRALDVEQANFRIGQGSTEAHAVAGCIGKLMDLLVERADDPAAIG